MALIELTGIGRSYLLGGGELKVLKDVTLTIEEGEFVAIVGPSGSGKSTLMQILGLLDRPTYGTYRLVGHDVSQLTDDEGAALRSKTIGFIFQMFNLLARTTTLDNVMLPMIYSGAPNREARAQELLMLIRDELRRGGLESQIPAGIVMTGGGALLRGLPELAEKIFNLPVRVAVPRGLGEMSEQVSRPEYSTAVGLVLYGARTRRIAGARPSGWVGKLKSMFAGA